MTILLIIHIGAGYVALASGLLAAAIKMLDLSHRWHIVAGRMFVWAMAGIFSTAIPISIATNNLFLLLIAVFSFYLALSGWRYARNRAGTPATIDWIRSVTMLIGSAAMAAFGVALLRAGNNDGITLLVFSAIGAALSANDLRVLVSGGVTGAARVANHLTMMLAGTIATITAFAVVNVTFQPAYVVWLAPTVVITPLIVAMNFKVRSVKRF